MAEDAERDKAEKKPCEVVVACTICGFEDVTFVEPSVEEDWKWAAYVMLKVQEALHGVDCDGKLTCDTRPTTRTHTSLAYTSIGQVTLTTEGGG